MISWEYWRRDLSTHILLLAVAVIWGSTWAVARFLSFGEGGQTSVGPATAAWIRYAFAVPVFFLWSASMRGRDGFRFFPPDRNSWKFSLWLGVLGTMGYQLLFMHGMRWTAAGDASLIIPINPVFTALLAVNSFLLKTTSSEIILNFFDLKITFFFNKILFSDIKFPSLAVIAIF